MLASVPGSERTEVGYGKGRILAILCVRVEGLSRRPKECISSLEVLEDGSLARYDPYWPVSSVCFNSFPEFGIDEDETRRLRRVTVP